VNFQNKTGNDETRHEQNVNRDTTFGRFWSQINICCLARAGLDKHSPFGTKWGSRMHTKKGHYHSYLKSGKLERDIYHTDETQTVWEIRKVFRTNSRRINESETNMHHNYLPAVKHENGQLKLPFKTFNDVIRKTPGK